MSIWHKPDDEPVDGKVVVIFRGGEFHQVLVTGEHFEFDNGGSISRNDGRVQFWAYVDDLANDARASIGLAEMVRLDQEMGLYGKPNPMIKDAK